MGRGTPALAAPRDSRALLPPGPVKMAEGVGGGCVPNLRPVLLIRARTVDLLNTSENPPDPAWVED